MNKYVKMGILASAAFVPAVVVNANDNVDLTVPQMETVAISSNTVAEIGVNALRLQELLSLNETTAVADFTVYRTMIDELGSINSYERELLKAKIDYLEEIASLKSTAAKINSEIALLKTTNPDTIAKVEQLAVEELGLLEDDFRFARTILDDEINSATGYRTNFITDGFGFLSNYTGAIVDFKAKYVPNEATLLKFKQDIIKPKAFIASGIAKSDGNLFEKLLAYDKASSIATTTDIQAFRDIYAQLNLDYTTNLTADEKKIFESHALADDRTVLQVINTAKADLTAADKVTALIDSVDTTLFTSASTYASKIKSIQTEYAKLTDRQKKLVPKYDTLVLGSDTIAKDGYTDANNVISMISALKPNNTSEYRTKVTEAKTAYDELDTNLLGKDLKSYVLNYSTLQTLMNDLVVAVGPATPGSATIGVEQRIAALGSKADLIADDIIAARAAYNALTTNQKKVVNNYPQLQQWESTAKDSIKVTNLINNIVIEDTKKFAADTIKAQSAFNELETEQQKKLVSNQDRLEYMLPIAKIANTYYTMKVSSASSYRDTIKDLFKQIDLSSETTTNEEVRKSLELAQAASEADYNKLVATQISLEKTLKEADGDVRDAELVIASIETARDVDKKLSGPEQLEAIIKARTEYNDLGDKAKKLVQNLKILTELESIVKLPANAMKLIREADVSSASFDKQAKSAVAAFDKLTATQKSYLTDNDSKRVADFTQYLSFVAQMNGLKPSDKQFKEKVVEARNVYNDLQWQSDLDFDPILKLFGDKLDNYEAMISKGNALDTRINGLATLFGAAFMREVEAIDAAYTKLSADEKKQVTNYKYFQELKKESAAALKVVNLINNSVILEVNVANQGYEKAMSDAIKAYDKLTTRQKQLVYNYDSKLKPYLNVYEIVALLNKLKPTSKTYAEDVMLVRQQYERLTATEKKYLAPVLYKIEDAETGIAEVNAVMDLIDAAKPGVENYVQKLEEARVAYNRLARMNSAYPKLVLNAKTLMEREKTLKPVTEAIYQIQELQDILSRPFIDSNELVKKFNNASKAYEKIPYESRELVTNRDVLLSDIYPVATTIQTIANIKPGSKTFADDVKKARSWYDTLSDTDKALVANYKDLVAYEQIVAGGAAVDALIREIPTKSPTQYMQAIKDARAAYDLLSANEKKSVSLYKELTNYEKGVKNVLTAIDLIDGLQFASNLVSAYDKAVKSLDKLTADQRQMVPNLNKLTSVAPAIEVYKMIDQLKPSNESYGGAVQAAYAAYNRLTNSEKQYVTNFAQLQEAKNNVDNVAATIAKIAEISPSSRNYATQVEEALKLYNALPSAVKKLVTNADVLKTSQSELSAVDKVRSMIAEIDMTSSTFVSKVIAARTAYDKLSANQKRLVSNYFMLEEYERELNNMF